MREVMHGDLVTHMIENQTFGDVKERQVRRYSTLAVALAACDEKWEMFQETYLRLEEEGVGIGMTHVDSVIMQGMGPMLFRAGMHALKCRMTSKGVGDFEKYRKDFYVAVTELCGETERFAQERSMVVEDIMWTKAKVTDEESPTVWGIIGNSVKHFGSLSSSSAAAKQKCLKWIQKQLKSAIGKAETEKAVQRKRRRKLWQT